MSVRACSASPEQPPLLRRPVFALAEEALRAFGLRVEEVIPGRRLCREHDLVADLGDVHFVGAFEAIFRGQAHGLTAAVAEQFGGGGTVRAVLRKTMPHSRPSGEPAPAAFPKPR